MKPFRIPKENIRYVEFLDETPEGALSEAVKWLEQKNKLGIENSFYFLDLNIQDVPELGWLVTIYCGLERQ